MSKHISPRVLIPPPTEITTSSDCSNDCDCACALDTLPISLAENTLWQPNPLLQTLPLPENPSWRAVYNPQGPRPLAVLNQPAWELLNTHTKPRSLQAQTPAEQTVLNELAQAGFLIPLQGAPLAHPPSLLTAWLHLTDACNLRCDYCYLPHHPQTMSLDVGRQAIETLFASAKAYHYSGVKLKYAGGEPLLRFPLLQEIHQLAVETAQQTGIQLSAVLLTNGTLITEAHAAYLSKNQIRLMISLDGVGQWHDVQRHYARGEPSFKQVEHAIECAISQGIVPHISLTLSAKNLPGLPESIAWLLEHDLPFSLNFYRKNDCATAIRAIDISSPQTQQILEEVFALLEAHPPRHSLLGALTDRASFTASHLHPCSAGRDYLVIDPIGQIAKCQMEMHIPVTSLHAPDPLLELRQSPRGLQNPSITKKTDCHTCKWRFYCAGGCPILAKRVTGRFESHSPYCEIYQFLFPHLLRLESLRLITLDQTSPVMH